MPRIRKAPARRLTGILTVAAVALLPMTAQAAEPPTVETKPATSVNQVSAILNGTVNPNGSYVTTCQFEYGLTASGEKGGPGCEYGPGSGTTPIAVSALVTNLTPNTTYHFRIWAKNEGGVSRGSDQVFTTPPTGTGTPQYYANGTKVKEGTAGTKTYVGWGTASLGGSKSAPGNIITCHYAVAGTLLNPKGGGSSEGLTQMFATFQCEQEQVCPAGTTSAKETAEKLPWHNLLTEQVFGTIRQETTGVKLNLECFEGETRNASIPFVLGASEKGPRPKIVNGASALHPTLLEYAEGSGELEVEGSAGTITAKTRGAFKLLGYNAEELIGVANP